MFPWLTLETVLLESSIFCFLKAAYTVAKYLQDQIQDFVPANQY